MSQRLLTAWVFLLVLAISSPLEMIAQTKYEPVKVKSPQVYFEQMLEDVEVEGMDAIQARFDALGMSNPQTNAAIDIYRSTQTAEQKPFAKYIGSDRLADVHQTHYGYAYLGSNGWIFIRADFVRVDETEWGISGMSFNSEHQEVVSSAHFSKK